MAELVMEAIDETLGVAKIHLTGKIRRSQIVDARQMYCTIMRNFTNLSLSAIGNTIYRDHSTVIHSLKKHVIKLEVDPAYSQGYTELLDSIIYQIEYKTVKEKY